MTNKLHNKYHLSTYCL